MKKIQFMLDLYNRYRENLEFVKLPPDNLLINEESKLMLITPPKNFNKSITHIHEQLNLIKNEFINK